MDILNTQIPIYRAKKIYSDDYVIGYLKKDGDNRFEIIKEIMLNEKFACTIHEIDTSTLSIHFPDMLASDSYRLLQNGEKDLRIFASLSEDGKGGDIVKIQDYEQNKYVVAYHSCNFEFGILLIREENTDFDCWDYSPLTDESLDLFRVKGIKQ